MPTDDATCTVIVRFAPAKGVAPQAVLDRVSDVVRGAPGHDGFESVHLLQGIEDAADIWLVERFSDRASFERWLATDRHAAFDRAAPSLLRPPGDMTMLGDTGIAYGACRTVWSFEREASATPA